MSKKLKVTAVVIIGSVLTGCWARKAEQAGNDPELGYKIEPDDSAKTVIAKYVYNSAFKGFTVICTGAWVAMTISAINIILKDKR